MSFYRAAVLLSIAALCGCLTKPALAQDPGADKATGTSTQCVQKQDTDKQETPKEKDCKEEENENGKKKPSKLAGLMAAPLPISSPAIGSGIIPV